MCSGKGNYPSTHGGVGEREAFPICLQGVPALRPGEAGVPGQGGAGGPHKAGVGVRAPGRSAWGTGGGGRP